MPIDSTMSHRRRILNLVMANNVTGVYSLRRINLRSRQNDLFYPTAAERRRPTAVDAMAAAAEEARFDKVPIDLSSEYGHMPEFALNRMERIGVSPSTMRFQATPPPPQSDGSEVMVGKIDCFALSERKVAFMDRHSRVASLYDAGARCVNTMASTHVGGGGGAFRWNPWPIYLPVAGEDGDGDSVYAMEGAPEPEPEPSGDTSSDSNKFQFQALVHRNGGGWHCVELPPPPYVRDGGGYKPTAIDSYSAHGGAIWLSTKGIGTYCFDTASRAWSQVDDDDGGHRVLPFSGKIEHVPELGALVGFSRLWDGEDAQECYRLYASSNDLSSGSGGGSGRRSWRRDYDYDTLEHLRPPSEWRTIKGAQLIGLGSGKFCVVQFFSFLRRNCFCCHHDEEDRRFAVFTGVEVVRGVQGEDEAAGGGGGSAGGGGEGRLRLLKHKSKRYMFPDGNTVEFVL